MTSFLWQIAVPPRMQTHPHLSGMREFVQRFTGHARRAGDHVLYFPWVSVPSTPHGVTLNFHTQGYAPDCYHYKESFLQNWVQIDSHGYTGWHSSNVLPGLMSVAPGRFARMGAKLDAYLQSGKSKYEQAEGGFQTDSPFLFLPLQKPQDETSLFARFTPQEIVATVQPWLVQHGYQLVIKRHPFCHSPMIADWLEGVKKLPGIMVTDDNVVHLLARARAVLTVNSSVGFEALLRGIPVLSFGASEYGYMTQQVRSLSELPAMLDGLQATDRQEAIARFAAAHLYNIHDDADIADMHAALRPHRGFTPVPWVPDIDFSEGGNGHAYLLHGFSYPEAWGVWSRAQKATLVFYHDGAPVQKHALIKLHGYNQEDQPIQIFSLLWNGAPRAYWQQHRFKENSLETRVVANFQPGLNTLSFILHNPVIPAELQHDFDVRCLGIGIEGIQIRETI